MIPVPKRSGVWRAVARSDRGDVRAAEAAQPITGRGIGYKLFTRRPDPLDGAAEMQRVYRLLKEAREQGDIPWEWIVDETRALERMSTWADPAEYARASRDPIAATSGISSPSASRCGARRAQCAACSPRCSTSTRSGSASCTGSPARPASTTWPRTTTVATLIVLYVGDFDPSRLFMSEQDLPARLAKYGGDHVDAAAYRTDRASR